jgi:hypothetical protein
VAAQDEIATDPGPGAAGASGASGSWSLGTLIAVVLASRLIVLAAALVAENLVAGNPNLVPGAGGPVIHSLTTWDGAWYLGIVRDGYHSTPNVDGYVDYAFLPLYPMLVKLLALPFPGYEGLVAVITSNVLFAVAIALLIRLTEIRFGRGLAYRSAGMLALFPFSAAFSMAYAESLFTVLMLGAFLAVEHKRALPAGVLLALATLTRLQGLALIIPLAWILWERSGRPRPRLQWAWLLLGPAAALGAYAWVAWLTGDLTGYATAQGAWGRVGLGNDPQGNLAQGFTGAVALVHAINFTVLIVATFLLVFARRDRIPAAYVSVPVLFLGMTFLSGSIQSIGRLLLPAFPYDWILAGRRGFIGRTVWPVLSGALLFGISVLMFSGWFVP